MNITIERIKDPVWEQEVELAETKGMGHPDSICDDVVERAGKALADHYKKRFGKILHYNIDKALLIAGESRPAFSGGKITKPARLIIAGRATKRVGNKFFTPRNIIKKTAKNYLKQFNLAKFVVDVQIKQGALNLMQILKPKKPVANDTSFGCSHFPLSKAEKLTLDVRDFIEKHRNPAVGKDIKVMVARKKNKFSLTISIAFIDKFIKDMDEYVLLKNKIKQEIKKKFKVKEVKINTLDDEKGDVNSVYLTVSGLSAEMGDDGQVGRGNRYNNLITPGRPMAIEATAGKNIYHPGRSYQIAAYNIAKNLVKKTSLKAAEVKLLTNIGGILEDPKIVSIKAIGKADKKKIENVVKSSLKF